MISNSTSAAPAAPRGGATVGLLTDLPALEAMAVRNLRHWFNGPDSRIALRQDLQAALGPVLGRQAYENFGRLCNFCVTEGRRPLVRHGMTCTCLGADENCFANLVGAAAHGEYEDANLFAALIVQPQQAQRATVLAAKIGLILDQLSDHATSPAAHPAQVQPLSTTLH
ncbi:hypothetical protein [Phaeobacter gallaeciensis]|uniref:Uncharacterized protein n=1 Tax=Phaeobacter gallaeciensis TaxID=60890 RepID=A0AAC9ZC18_9RHOB|nr:hypothetical protein [Phaeobacter gallaeciensis]AHD10396.1 hypothetical protein Gal_02660 [Phaeobacter gallaeciensis DSM 26640]ATE93660.1 hypothetical protein PhaeoP11_02650 [Phaeobacter gallaeciensis]ATE96519.1 hypothetical protein PhaeoP73_01197 [Phaeobacter gallaeciensis]ATF02324.1 hypothetical protein PhaeoP75_02699 [Phaeobacter gallaeciensis]ATF06704.1 hypothetical protein PhaeoP63_02648 [Phaeobacter gallaeciensis]